MTEAPQLKSAVPQTTSPPLAFNYDTTYATACVLRRCLQTLGVQRISNKFYYLFVSLFIFDLVHYSLTEAGLYTDDCIFFSWLTALLIFLTVVLKAKDTKGCLSHSEAHGRLHPKWECYEEIRRPLFLG